MHSHQFDVVEPKSSGFPHDPTQFPDLHRARRKVGIGLEPTGCEREALPLPSWLEFDPEIPFAGDVGF